MFIEFLRKFHIPIICIAILLRIENLILFSGLNIDKAIQLAATYNFLNGHGILLSTVFTSDLNQICYVPFSGWPPGFTFWILPFTILNNNFHTVSVIADCFFMLILFVGVYKLLRSLFNERAKEYFSLFCLLNMFSFSPFYYFTSTDRYAVTFFIFALYFFVQLIQNKNNNRLNSLLTALFIFLAALTRFAYLPMTIFLPLSIIFIGKFKKDKQLIKNGLASLVLAFVLSASLYAFQKLYYGNGTYLEQAKFALHFENLLQFDPILFKTFFFTETFESQISKGSSLSSALITFKLLFTFTLLFHFLYGLFQRAKKNSHDILFYFDIVSLIALSITIGTLVLLSIVSPATHFNGNLSWTYVEESRYYAPVILIFQIYLIRLALGMSNDNLRKLSRVVIYSSISFSILYFSFKHYKILIKHEYAGTYFEDKKVYIDLSKQLKDQANDNELILIASKDETSRTTSIYSGGVPVSNYDSLINTTAKIPMNKTIWIECKGQKTIEEENFLNRYSGEVIFTSGESTWYKISTQ